MGASSGLDEACDRLRRIGYDLVWYGLTHLLCRGLERICDNFLVVPTSAAGRMLCESASLRWQTPEEFAARTQFARPPLGVLCFEEDGFLAGLQAPGLDILRPPVPVVVGAANKIGLQSIAMAAGAPYIPSIALELADPASTACLARRLGGDAWVVQRPENNLTGRGTYRADSTDELACLLEVLRGKRVKVARFVSGVSLTVSACVHPRGTIVSYLSRQIVGVSALTVHWAAHCGNDIAEPSEVSDVVVQKIRDVARGIGDVLRTIGFRGCFGLDIILDEFGVPLVVEINPRFQSVSSVGLAGEIARGRFPLAIWHVLAFLEPDILPPALVDPDAAFAPFSQIVAEHLGGDDVTNGAIIPGCYVLNAAAPPRLVEPGGWLRLGGEPVVTPLIVPGEPVVEGTKLFCLQTPGSVCDIWGLRLPLVTAVRQFRRGLGLDSPRSIHVG